jgi:hypothetical protein
MMGGSVLAAVGDAALVLGGISWEPEIRGALVVLVGGTVLFGSVWLLLTTNIGNRLGSLNALAGFFGWMFILGLIWWVYGFGLIGTAPSWEPKEVVFGDLSSATTGNVSDLGDATLVDAPTLVDSFCPGLVDATVEAQRSRVLDPEGVFLLTDFYEAPADRPWCLSEELGELLAIDTETITENLVAANDALGPDDPRFLDEAALQDRIDTVLDDEFRRDQQLTLSAVASVSPELIEAAKEEGSIDARGWTLISNAEAGEAQATADAFLNESAIDPFETSGEFLVLNTFQTGGKPTRSSNSMIDRVWNEIRNTVLFWHPTNTIVVQVAPTIEKPTIEGQPPPFPEIDREGQVVSVVMERDLGTRRLPAALISMGSLILFLALCWMLHTRDKELRQRLENWDPTAAAS